MINLKKVLSVRNIAIFVITMMCINYIPVDTRGDVSLFKVAICAISPLLLLIYSPKLSKALLWGGLYVIAAMFSGMFHPESFRSSTVVYNALLVCGFIMYYNLVYLEQAFDIDYFIKYLKRFIFAFTIVLLIQQAFILVGIKQFALINLIQILDRGIGANSLAAEPSTFARVIAVLFLALLRMYEIKWGKDNVTIKAIYADAKWVVIGFLWCMLTMGSGTSFIALILLSLYFVKRQYIITALPVLVAFFLIAPHIEFEPLQRALVSIEATAQFDQEAIMEADGSADARIVPIINTFTELDLLTKEAWFGNGVDYGLSEGHFSKIRMIGGISDYGLIVFIFSVIFIYTCCIKGFFSLESIMYIILLQMSIPNIPVFWGIFMIWSTVKYFQQQNQTQHDLTDK